MVQQRELKKVQPSKQERRVLQATTARAASGAGALTSRISLRSSSEKKWSGIPWQSTISVALGVMLFQIVRSMPTGSVVWYKTPRQNTTSKQFGKCSSLASSTSNMRQLSCYGPLRLQGYSCIPHRCALHAANHPHPNGFARKANQPQRTTSADTVVCAEFCEENMSTQAAITIKSATDRPTSCKETTRRL